MKKDVSYFGLIDALASVFYSRQTISWNCNRSARQYYDCGKITVSDVLKIYPSDFKTLRQIRSGRLSRLSWVEKFTRFEKQRKVLKEDPEELNIIFRKHCKHFLLAIVCEARARLITSTSRPLFTSRLITRHLELGDSQIELFYSFCLDPSFSL